MKGVIFPGEGSQYVGMGKSLYEGFPCVRDFFNRIDKILGWKLSECCFYGPSEELNPVYVQELAILAVSLSAYEVFKEKNIPVDFLSGLSSGECSCLYSAGVLDLEDLVYFVKERAWAMGEASQRNPSSLFAVIGLERGYLEEKSAEGGFYLANINSPKQIVIALKKEDRERIKKSLGSAGAKVVELEVDGGFHSPFMQVTKEQFKRKVENLKFKDARIPIVSNFTATAHTKKEEIKSNLIEQLVSPVLWQDCAEFMIKNGVKVFFEIGPSQILRGLIKTINPRVEVINIEAQEDLMRPELMES